MRNYPGPEGLTALTRPGPCRDALELPVRPSTCRTHRQVHSKPLPARPPSKQMPDYSLHATCPTCSPDRRPSHPDNRGCQPTSPSSPSGPFSASIRGHLLKLKMPSGSSLLNSLPSLSLHALGPVLLTPVNYSLPRNSPSSGCTGLLSSERFVLIPGQVHWLFPLPGRPFLQRATSSRAQFKCRFSKRQL